MAVIEGIGDEVLYFFVVVGLGLVAVLAWLSTNTPDRPLLRTVVILERHQPRTAITAQPSASVSPTSQPAEKPPDINALPETSQSEISVPQEEVEPSVRSVLRRRFAGQGEGLQATNTNVIEGRTLDAPSPGPTDEFTSVEAASQRENERGDSSGQSSSRLVELMDEDGAAALTNAAENTPRDIIEEAVLIKGQELLEQSEDEISESSGESRSIGSEEVMETVPDNVTEETPTIRINLKYLNDDLKSVEGSLGEQVGDFKRRHFSLELSGRNIVRLVFNGKLLGQDSLTLGNYGLHDNCIVHCLVHQQRTPPPSPDLNARSPEAAAGGDARGMSTWALSNLLLMVLSVLLGVAWYGRYQYAQWFTATTTVALVGLTGIFTVFLIGIYIPDTTQA